MADPLALAFEAYDVGKFDEAGVHCTRALAAEPHNAQALLLAGLVAKKRSRFEDAIAFLENSLSQVPSPTALGSLAECLAQCGRIEEALHCLQQLTAVDPTNADAYLLESAILYGLRRYDAALERTLRARTYLPESYLVEARLGCILLQLGHHAVAEIHFWNAARLAPKFAHCRLINLRQDLWEKITAPIQPAQAPGPAVLREARGGQPFDAVVAVFCDARYFYKYGAAFINSFAQNAAAGKLLHLHVMDPDEGFTVYLDSVMARVLLPDFVVTSAATPFAITENYNARRTYYSCARFVALGSLLRHYKTAIACLDIDLIFETPIDALLAATVNSDVGLVPRDPPESPWLDIEKGLVIANHTEQASRYLSAVGSFISHFAARDEWYWHLDQIAFFCVLKMMERYATLPDVCWIPQSARSALWHIGTAYDFRREDARVVRYRLAGLPAPAATGT